MFKSDAKKIFNTKVLLSDEMEKSIELWNNVAAGRAPWIDKEDDIESISFAKFIASDVAKKACLDIDIHVTGSVRADHMQQIIDKLKRVLRDKVEDAAITGGIMFKQNGSDNVNNCIDYVTTNNFLVTDKNSNGDILGVIFFDFIERDKKYYRRLEWHRFENEIYRISNKAFESTQVTSLGKEIALAAVSEWEDIAPEVGAENIEKPLYAYFKMPFNNTIDRSSALGVSVFANALTELKDLDVAWSRKSGEVQDSKHITFVSSLAQQFANNRKVKLPRYIKPLEFGTGKEDTIPDREVTLLTDQRIADINSILSMISTKCGYSQGAFVLDRKTGNITAKQVESDDRETIETIKDIRDALKETLEQLIYAINVYEDLYDVTPVG